MDCFRIADNPGTILPCDLGAICLTTTTCKDPRKRDSVGAFKLAELLRVGRVHEVYYPDEAHRAVFKQLMQHYDDVVAQQVRLKLKIKARLRVVSQFLMVNGVIPHHEFVMQLRSRIVPQAFVVRCS